MSCILDDCSEEPWDQEEAGEALRGSWPMPVNCCESGREVCLQGHCECGFLDGAAWTLSVDLVRLSRLIVN